MDAKHTPKISLWMVRQDGGEPSPWWATSRDEALLMAERDNAGMVDVETYTARRATITEYRGWYEETVGYDPMAETPPMAKGEFLKLCREYVEAEGK